MIDVHSVAGEGILVAPMTALRIYIDRNEANQMTTGVVTASSGITIFVTTMAIMCSHL